MNVIKTTLAAGLVLAAGLGNANVLSRSDIERAAEGFLKNDAVGASVLFGRTVRSVEPHGNLWLVRLAPSGYIVLAGSDEAEPVPFFSPKDFVEPAAESAFAAVLAGADDACAKLEAAAQVKNSLCLMTLSSASTSSEDDGSTRRKARWSSLLGTPSAQVRLNSLASVDTVPSGATVVVAPFLTTHWNQWQPYNDYSPLYHSASNGTYRGRTACGCVATAAAQGFHYWQWPARMDEVRTVTHQFAPDGKAKGYSGFPIRFDGRVPFEWAALSNEYTSSYSDMRGKVAESVRHPIARLIFLCGSLAEMAYAPSGSSATFWDVRDNAPWYQGGEWLRLQEGGAKLSDWSTNVGRFRSNIVSGVPVQVSIPGHAVVGHGWAESSTAKYAYINYGWGGDNDGYYNLDDVSSSSSILSIYVDFVPRPMVQLDPVPKVLDSSVALNWHLPNCYANSVQSFTVSRAVRSTMPSDMTEDFETTTSSGDFELATSATYSDSRFLHIGPLVKGTYPIGDQLLLTSRSVLTFDILSSLALGQSIEIQASFDGGAWTTISKPHLNLDSSSKAWKTIRAYLGDHGGQQASFRIYATRSGYYYPSGDGVAIDNVVLTSVMDYITEEEKSIRSSVRTCTFTGLTAGADYQFTVTPKFSTGDGESGNVFVPVAGTRQLPLPGVESFVASNLAYSASSSDGIWTIVNSNGTEANDKSFWLGPWSGSVTAKIMHTLAASSKLTFSLKTNGYYNDGSNPSYAVSYDTLKASFVDATDGSTSNFWSTTITEEKSTVEKMSLSLADFAGKRGDVVISFVHSGAQFTSQDNGVFIDSPVVTDMQVPQLPELSWGPATTLTALGMPTIESVSSETPAFGDGFYRENAMGTNVFYVTCSSSVVSLTASPSHVALLPDDKVTVHPLGEGRFAVVIDATQIPERYSRSRMILTLAASDANGTTVCKDLSMRFSVETSPQVYPPEVPTAVEVKEGELTVSVPTSWLEEKGLVASGASAAEQLAAVQADADGDGQANWKEYVCGTDPNDPTKNLKCLISFVDGEVLIDYEPKNLAPGFKPVFQGRTTLGSGDWELKNTTTHRFFRVIIEQ